MTYYLRSNRNLRSPTGGAKFGFSDQWLSSAFENFIGSKSLVNEDSKMEIKKLFDSFIESLGNVNDYDENSRSSPTMNFNRKNMKHSLLPVPVLRKQLAKNNKERKNRVENVMIDNNNSITINGSKDGFFSTESLNVKDDSNPYVMGLLTGNGSVTKLSELINNSERISLDNGDVFPNQSSHVDSNLDLDEMGNKWLLERCSLRVADNENVIVGLKNRWSLDPSKMDPKTRDPSNGKGASCLLFSVRHDSLKNKKLNVLLGLEKHGKYATTYNIFGGHYEEDKDDGIASTVRRELGEEFGNSSILSWVNWKGSHWSFNRSFIEFGIIPEKFDIDRGFRENDEMRGCKWFSVDDVLNSVSDSKEIEVDDKITRLKYYKLTDSEGNEFRISSYAYGVITAARNNKHFEIKKKNSQIPFD